MHDGGGGFMTWEYALNVHEKERLLLWKSSFRLSPGL